MKKRMLFLLASVVCATCVNCSALASSEDADDFEFDHVSESDSGNRYAFTSLPCDMDYNGEKIVFESADFFQTKSASGYGYIPYLIVTVDVSALSDESLYWLDKDEDFRISAYLTSDDNGIDFEAMQTAKGVDYGDKRSYAFTYLDEQKNPFYPSNFSVTIDLTQDEVYESGELKINKFDTYQYVKFIESESDLAGPGILDIDMVDSINEALEILDSPESLEIYNVTSVPETEKEVDGAYAVSELYNLQNEHISQFDKMRRAMTDEELYGLSDDEEERADHLHGIILESKKEFYKDYDISNEDKIKISGIFLSIDENDDGEKYITVCSSDDLSESIYISTSDEHFADVTSGSEILVEAEFAADENPGLFWGDYINGVLCE